MICSAVSTIIFAVCVKISVKFIISAVHEVASVCQEMRVHVEDVRTRGICDVV